MTSGDGVFTYRHGVAAAQIAVFSVFLLVGIYFRRTKRQGWLTITEFSLFRIVGASCHLALINNHSIGLWITAFIFESQGVLLLLFLLVKLLRIVNGLIQGLHVQIFHIPTIIAAVELAFAIVGAVKMANADNQLTPSSYSTAAAALIILNLASVLIIAAFLWLRRERVPAAYKRVFSCVFTCALPLVVRMVYTLIYTSTRDKMWSSMRGNATLYLFLSAIQEMIAMAICSWTIFKLPPGGKAGDGKGGDEEAKGRKYSPLTPAYDDGHSGGRRGSY